MINRVRDKILSASSECAKRLLSKMEALEHITDVSQMEEVWDRNRVPYMEDDELSEEVFVAKRGRIIRVPDALLKEENPGEEFIKFCYDRGFEPGEFITGITYDTNMEACFLCELALYKGMSRNLFNYNRLVPKQVDMIIYESPNFYVTSELGAMKYGYLMIVPKAHILSVAQFPKELFPEYWQVMSDTEILLKGTYGKDKVVTFWEHGSGPSGFTSHKKSIVHAHTHVIVDFKLKQKYLDMVQMKPIADIAEAKDTHYFSYQEGSKGQLLCCYDDRVYVQRQYPRQIMAEEMHLAPGHYNWRNVDFTENIEATLFHLFRYLRTERTSRELPERVKERTNAFLNAYDRREDVKASLFF